MGMYCSKKELYNKVAKLKNELGFEENTYGINLIDVLSTQDIKIESIPFNTSGLRGMAIAGSCYKDDIILLNSARTAIEQNFDCGHELIHLTLHRNLSQKTFNCFEKITPNQNPYLEWQANEGAAEFFVPYKELLPLVKICCQNLANTEKMECFIGILHKHFNVPDTVIKYRLENLRYEISQYLNGVPLEQIEILSLKKQKERDINIESLSSILDSIKKRERILSYWQGF